MSHSDTAVRHPVGAGDDRHPAIGARSLGQELPRLRDPGIGLPGGHSPSDDSPSSGPGGSCDPPARAVGGALPRSSGRRRRAPFSARGWPSSSVRVAAVRRRNLRRGRARSRTATSSWLAVSVRCSPDAGSRPSSSTAMLSASCQRHAVAVALVQRGADRLGRAAHRDEAVLVGDRAVVGQPVDLVVLGGRRRPRRRRSRPRRAWTRR